MDREFRLKRIKELEEEIKLLNSGIEPKKEIVTYKYSRMQESVLRELVDIKRNMKKTIFDSWFNNDILIEKNVIKELEKLLEIEGDYIDFYKEADLKMRFLSPIFKLVDFKTEVSRDFYEESLRYENENFIFNGFVDIVISKGVDFLEKPYFFIQEFKRDEGLGVQPRVQLLAELISAVELNNWTKIKGAYLRGAMWHFVILEKLDKDKYQYFVSKRFDSSNIDGLKSIYKNLLFIKNEIAQMIKDEK